MNLRAALRRTPLRKWVIAWRDRKPVDVLDVQLVPPNFGQWFMEVVRLNPIPGHYVEFGVYNGLSLAMAYAAFAILNRTDVHLFGFDSFQGLPAHAAQEGAGMWQAGQCACDLETTQRLLQVRHIDMSRVSLIPGWFKDTLMLWRQHQIGQAAYIMIDCDLYSSAMAALFFVEPLIKDRAIVIFDDWNGFQAAEQGLGEAKAFEEFLALYPFFDVEELPAYSDDAKAFRLTRR